MNITKETQDNSTFSISLKITKEDYEPKVNKALKDYRKTAQIKGFRPGKAPLGLVQKMVGPSILMQEVDTLVSEHLSKYITDEKLNLLGQPLPSSKQQPIDPIEDKVFEFFFDMAVAPEFELVLDKRTKVPFYTITVSDKMITDEIERTQNQFGKTENDETVNERSYVKANISQLDTEGNIIEDGISTEETMLSVDLIKNKTEKKKIVGKKIGDTFKLDLKKAYPNDTELSGMLNIEKEAVDDIKTPFSITLTEITTFTASDINQELFDKVYGEGIVKTEEEFKEKIKESIERIYSQESDFRFAIDAKDKIVSKLKLDLPEEFLKRWIKATNTDKELTDETLNKEYPMFEKDLQWQLVKNKIAEAQEFKISEDEIRQESRKFTEAQFAQYGLPLGSLSDEQMQSFVDKNLEKEEDRTKFAEKVIENKANGYIKSTIKLEDTIIDFEDFKKLYENA